MDIVRTDIPTSWQVCSDTIDALVKAYPVLRSETLAVTPGERTLRTLVIGRGERTVFYSAAYHANEWITAPVLLRFAQELAQAVQTGGRIFGVRYLFEE